MALRGTHNITAERFDEMLAEQNGDCAFCGRDISGNVSYRWDGETVERRHAQVDHDHECCPGPYSCGKCIRGIVCPGCNRRLASYDRSGLKQGAYLRYLALYRLRRRMSDAAC